MAWPFQKPVDGNEITDYYEQIKEPMGKYFIFFFKAKTMAMNL